MSLVYRSKMQRLFNISYTHVVKQGAKSTVAVNSGWQCVYRTHDGKGCAASPFILEYKPEMEGRDWNRLMHVAKLAESFNLGCFDPDAEELTWFVCELQSIHDGMPGDGYFLNTYKERAREFAAHHGLTVPEVL